jgi:TRAP-type transport system periplasmic protein
MSKLLREKANLEVLCWTGGTQRNVFIKKEPTASMSTLKGVKIRTPESAIYVNTFKALGANPTPIPATEMYSAIQSGVVDAMEGSFDTVYTYKIFEVAKYCLETGHITEDNSYVMNAKAFQKLPADLQKAILDGAKEASVFQRKEAGITNDSVKQKLGTEGGMKFTVANHDELVKAVAPVYKTFADKSAQCAEIIKKMGKY